MAVISTTAHGNQSAVTLVFGKSTQVGGSTCMRRFAELEVGNRVTVKAIRTTLQQNELRPDSPQIVHHLGPYLVEFRIAGTRWQWHVHLGSLRLTTTRFARSSRTRVKESAILVYIGEDKVGIFLKTIENAVAVMCINIHIRDSVEVIPVAEILGGDPAVIEHTEARRMPTTSMMESGYRHERLRGLPCHAGIHCGKRRAHNIASTVEHTRERRCVSAIEESASFDGCLGNEIDVIGRVKEQKFIRYCPARRCITYGITEIRVCKRRMKNVVTIRTKWVVIAKPVTSDLVSAVNVNR